MKLSVIIPVYRVEGTLDRCVQSVVDQTFADLDIILVDDGSPDLCPQLCDAWARRDGRISVVHKQNGGLSDARNAGLLVAKGDCVAFVDSDDHIALDTYERQMPLMEHADIVEFPLTRHSGTLRQQPIALKAQAYTEMKDYWLHGHAYEHTYACNKVFRRQLFSDVQFPKGKLFEDAWTLPLLLQKTKRIVVNHVGMYHYCSNADSITATADGAALAMLLEAHMQVLPHWCDDRYYMHVLNIQLDVARLSGAKATLPTRRVHPLGQGLTPRQRVKAVLLNLLGIETLCNINRRMNKTGTSRS
jgi:glycosyltransferase involved in cell wall biosynthesis